MKDAEKGTIHIQKVHKKNSLEKQQRKTSSRVRCKINVIRITCNKAQRNCSSVQNSQSKQTHAEFKNSRGINMLQK